MGGWGRVNTTVYVTLSDITTVSVQEGIPFQLVVNASSLSQRGINGQALANNED